MGSGSSSCTTCSYHITLLFFRIHLEFLQNPEEAVKIVRDVQSVEGAKMVAR